MGTVDRVVAFYTRAAGFESSHCLILMNLYFLLTIAREENMSPRMTKC